MRDARTALRVTGVHRLGSPFVRIETEVVDGALVLPGAPDEACVLHLPLPDGGLDPLGRWYTVRRISPDGARVTFDVVVHEGGVGAGWARRARAGERIEVSRSASWYRRPDGVARQVLVGDAAAVPALARIVEESDGVPEVVVELPPGSGPPPLPDGTAVRVVHPEPGTSTLEAIVRGLDLEPGRDHVYVAGEAAATRAVRRYLRHERGMSPADYRTVGYWRRDAEGFRRRYDAAPDWFADAWARAEAAGGDDEERVLDHYERTLSEAGVI